MTIANKSKVISLEPKLPVVKEVLQAKPAKPLLPVKDQDPVPRPPHIDA